MVCQISDESFISFSPAVIQGLNKASVEFERTALDFENTAQHDIKHVSLYDAKQIATQIFDAVANSLLRSSELILAPIRQVEAAHRELKNAEELAGEIVSQAHVKAGLVLNSSLRMEKGDTRPLYKLLQSKERWLPNGLNIVDDISVASSVCEILNMHTGSLISFVSDPLIVILIYSVPYTSRALSPSFTEQIIKLSTAIGVHTYLRTSLGDDFDSMHKLQRVMLRCTRLKLPLTVIMLWSQDKWKHFLSLFYSGVIRDYDEHIPINDNYLALALEVNLADALKIAERITAFMNSTSGNLKWKGTISEWQPQHDTAATLISRLKTQLKSTPPGKITQPSN